MRNYFGTDGVRGIANKELTPTLAFNLSRAGGHVLNKYSKNSSDRILAIVGSDTRISKDVLSCAVQAGFMSTGIDVIDVGVLPTPAIAYLTQYYKADIGAVISASHNPMEFNGIKFFNSMGYKLADEIEIEIEECLEDLEKITEYPTGEKVGRNIIKEDSHEKYIDFLIKEAGIDLSGLKIVLDTANGASYQVAPDIYKRLNAQVVTINSTPNGININDKCGSTHVESLKKEVVKQKADFGLAYDGDADRLIAVDENGEVVDGDKIMMICALYMKENAKLKNDTLVVTVMSNMGLHVAAKENKINLEITDVGDRYVLENMQKNGHCLGGEQSGHIIFSDIGTTGDGILSSLMLSKIVKTSGKTLSQLAKVMDIYPQVLVNVKVENEYKKKYKEIKEIQDKIKSMEEEMKDTGRVLIRPSGTEPLVRVMLEGKNLEQITNLANELAEIIKNKCN